MRERSTVIFVGIKSNKERQLFIGGCRDGEWVECSKAPIIRCPQPVVINISRYEKDQAVLDQLKYDSYKISEFHTSKKTFGVRSEINLTPDEIFEKLLNNYRPENK